MNITYNTEFMDVTEDSINNTFIFNKLSGRSADEKNKDGHKRTKSTGKVHRKAVHNFIID